MSSLPMTELLASYCLPNHLELCLSMGTALLALACLLSFQLLSRLGVTSLLYGLLCALGTALAVRLADAYLSALAAHLGGECGVSAILVSPQNQLQLAGSAAVLTALALACTVLCGCLVGGSLGTATRYPVAARAAAAATLLACVGLAVVGPRVPTSELLSTLWSGQRLCRALLQGLGSLGHLTDPALWLGLLGQRLMPSMRTVLTPHTLAAAWALTHPACYKDFILASYTVNAAFLLCFAASVQWGANSTGCKRKVHAA